MGESHGTSSSNAYDDLLNKEKIRTLSYEELQLNLEFLKHRALSKNNQTRGNSKVLKESSEIQARIKAINEELARRNEFGKR